MKGLKVFMAAVVLLISLESAFACSCARPESPVKSLEQATAVFAGKVVKIKRERTEHRPQSKKTPTNMFSRVEVHFEVEQIWKGLEKKTAVVYTTAHSAACGYHFQKDEIYIVYAHVNGKDQLHTTICSRTKPLADAEEDLEELGAGKVVKGENRTYKTY